MSRIDAWVGRTLFVPLIIRLCQLTGWSQWRVSRTASMFFWLSLIASWSDRAGWMIRTLDVLCCLGAVVGASLFPDAPMTSGRLDRLLRRFFLGFTFLLIVLNAAVAFTGGTTAWGFLITSIAILTAEYAKTIHTIPPRELRSAKARKVRA